MSRYLNYVLDAVRRPRKQLTRGQHQLRYAWELAVHCGGQLNRHRAEGMAAELTYRTIFALIPVVVLGLVMFRVFGGLEDVQSKVENQLYSFFGVPEIPIDYLSTPILVEENVTLDDASDSAQDAEEGRNAEEGQGSGEADAASQNDEVDQLDESTSFVPTDTSFEEEIPPSIDDPKIAESQQVADAIETARTARASIRRSLHDLTSQIASIDFASVGVVGLLLFIYAAIALADSTEYLFNRIYNAPSKRPIHIRVAIHWSIITLGSGLLAMSLYLSSQVVDWFGTIGWVGATNSSIPTVVLTHLLSTLASWVLLFLLYALMPNTDVSVRAAGVGAGVSALMWEAAKYGFQIYVAKAVPYSAIYGSLGLIPLFLFWMYVTWLIVLFGLILTYTLQTLGGRRLRQADRELRDLPDGDPDWMLPIMTEVADAFGNGEAIGRQKLADQLGLSSRVIREMEGKLIESGLLRRVSSATGQGDTLTLGRPAEKIPVRQILEVAHRSRPTNDHPAWQTLANLKRAERDAAGEKTLADLLPFSLKCDF